MYIYDGNKQDTTDRISEKHLEINSIGFQGSYATRTVRANGRRDYTLIYVDEGTLYAAADGKAITVESCGFILYPPHMPQDYYFSDIKTVYWMHFGGKCVSELLCDAGLTDVYFHTFEKRNAEISRLFKKTLFDFSLELPTKNAILTADIAAIVAALGSAFADGVSSASQRLAPVIIKMNRDYPKRIDVDDCAKMCGVTKSRFHHIFKNATGISPYAYLTRLRLSRAAELLLSTLLPISEIAYEVGFDDPLNFSKIFKRHYGVSPDIFRKK